MATDTEQRHDTARVAREYFEALARGESDAPRRFFAPDGSDHIHGVLGPADPGAASQFFAELFGAFPDWRFEVLDMVVDGDRAAVRWRARATFAGPGRFQGMEPNGARVQVEGNDMVWVRDGRIARIEAYMNGAQLAQQIGTLPPSGSATEARLIKAFNARTRVRRLIAGEPERIAEGVWILRGGFPTNEMSVFLVRDSHSATGLPGTGRDGVLLFDAGIRAMTDAVAAAGASLGGITRVVLGHSHADHRGVAPGLGAPVLCHPAEKADAEGDGGMHYFDFAKLAAHARLAYPYLLRTWDGGPVQIAGTIAEGDEIAGFEVVHLPGHAPGQIGLWRAGDRLALTSDCFYTLDPQTVRHGPPRLPHEAFNFDTEAARASIRKLAALEPATAWPSHAEPATGDVRAQLESAAAAP
jgi:glyoxylase-like metal-dependent hydrolase (beta-lactamase superfamily II)/predicted ester cyclase